MPTRLHGTDGIRGKIGLCSSDENPIEKLISQREISTDLFTIIGQATGTVLQHNSVNPSGNVDERPLVVIGWDRREGNAALVTALESGLVDSGCRVQRVGELPTPGLLHCLLSVGGDAGMMVTASHNPAHDSGVKLFDSDGFKSMPELEDLISAEAMNPSGQFTGNGEVLEPLDGLRVYRQHLKRTLESLISMFDVSEIDIAGCIASQGLLLDCSGGSATGWFAAGLARRGIECQEVSSLDVAINQDCGAGAFNPTDQWNIQQLLEGESAHALLNALRERLIQNDGMAPWESGQIVGAALDGDGDRCLLLEAVNSGIRVIDGDQMALDWLTARHYSGSEKQKLAFSIESDLCLADACAELGVEAIQTAVGDRWLAASLAPKDNQKRLLWGSEMPAVCGSEDSGHLVMPSPHPTKKHHWAFAGDGAVTLLAQLCGRAAVGDRRRVLARGWKKRVSVTGVNRKLWDGRNAVAQEVVAVVKSNLNSENFTRNHIVGEDNLLLLESDQTSIGVRNSGTEAKTSISIRARHRENVAALVHLIDKLSVLLEQRLIE